MKFSDGNLLCHGFSAMPDLINPDREQLLRIVREGPPGYSPPRYLPPNPPNPLSSPAAPPPRYGEAPPRYEPRAPSN